MPTTNRIIYLDYNATAPLLPAVKEGMLNIMDTPNNASAIHKAGRAARMAVENAREQVAKSIGAKTEGVIFTSGATEANNMALNGITNHTIYAGATEHPAILNAVDNINILSVDHDGLIDLEALNHTLSALGAPALVSVMMVNNETGVIQPIKKIASIVHKHGGILHSDCVQALGRIELNMQETGIDMLSLSAHKLGGPQGVGVLVIDPKIELTPILRGGGQEKNRRAGTENVTGIVGFGIAAEQSTLTDTSKLEKMRDRLEQEIKATAPEVIIHGENAPRVANTSMFSLSGVPSDTQMIHMDLAGIAVSNGSACSSGRVEPSHVLKAMGCDDNTMGGSALRVSMGWDTKESDIDAFIEAWKTLYDRVGSRLNS